MNISGNSSRNHLDRSQCWEEPTWNQRSCRQGAQNYILIITKEIANDDKANCLATFRSLQDWEGCHNNCHNLVCHPHLHENNKCWQNIFSQVFVTAGLGGMSGAQAKAAVICGCVGVIAEVVLLLIVGWRCYCWQSLSFPSQALFQVSREALEKRHRQGWVLEVVDK